MLALFVSLVLAHLPIVALDAGHGGTQSGAVGSCGAIEKEVTLAVAQKLSVVLKTTGQIEPLLIRAQDETLALEERAQRANLAKATLLLSIHANASSNEAAHGIEVFFLSSGKVDQRLAKLAARENAESQRLKDHGLRGILSVLQANAVHHESRDFAINLRHVLAQQLQSTGRGVLQAPFAILSGAQMPAVLVEIGFLTHAEECTLLTNARHQQRIAEGLGAAILNHVNRSVPDSLAKR